MFFGLLRALIHVLDAAERRERKKTLVARFVERVKTEGGEILGVRSLNSRMIVNSPFVVPSRDDKPVLIELRCRYKDDSGWWMIQVPTKGRVQWTWKSENRRDRPPVKRDGATSVNNDVIVFPLWVTALVISAFVGLVVGIFALSGVFKR